MNREMRAAMMRVDHRAHSFPKPGSMLPTWGDSFSTFTSTSVFGIAGRSVRGAVADRAVAGYTGDPA